jgi:NAD(P)-dependent dehydrogenase (short-subunit alcohol dehydrogenase family)
MSKVYCLDRLAEPDEEFNEVAARLAPSFQGALRYDHVDVRDTLDLERVVESIACKHSRLDGLIAAAGIQHITPALEYLLTK